MSEIDIRSSRFTCALTIESSGAPIELVEITPRFPRGVAVVEALGEATLSVRRRHHQTAAALGRLLTLKVVAQDRTAEARGHGLKSSATPRLFGDLGARLRWRGGRPRDREEQIRVTIPDLAAAEAAIRHFDLQPPNGPQDPVVQQLLAELRRFETDPDFSNKGAAAATIFPSAPYEAVYILRARRGLLNVACYPIAFEIALRDSAGQPFTRVKAGSLSVAPGAIPLVLVAMAASLIGAALALARGIDSRAPKAFADEFGANLMAFPLAALTALIVFNVMDFTALRSQVKGHVSWRTATLVGFLCGFLNERVLAVVEALLGVK